MRPFSWLMLGIFAFVSPLQAAETPPLVPQPASVELGEGTLALTAKAAIATEASELAALADVLAGEIEELTGREIAVRHGAGRPGDVVLTLDDALKGEAYQLDVADRATVRAGNYAAVAGGTATLLQLLDPQKRTLPHVSIEDEPAYGYRGVMIDVARQPHTLDTLRDVVRLCRVYKIRYVHLHLNDNEGWTFPSTAYPQLGTRNHHKVPRYDLDELKALVRFADERGVTLVPELETPGHFGAAIRAMPEVFDSRNEQGKSRRLGCLNMANEEAYEVLDTLVGEVAEVFASSPYIHIGCDEVWLEVVSKTPEAKVYFERHGLRNGSDMYNLHIVRMNDMVRERGKQTIVWEGFHGDGTQRVKIPKNVIAMPFENSYNNARSLTGHGYTVINTAWRPLYITRRVKFDIEEIYNWNLFKFGHYPRNGFHNYSGVTVEPTPLVIGAQICCWEQTEELVIPSLRQRLPTMSQRVWNPKAHGDFEAFAERLAAVDRVAAALVRPLPVKEEGLAHPAANPLSDNVPSVDTRLFKEQVEVTLAPVRPLRADETVRYTLDGEVPTADSPELPQTLSITKVDANKNNVATLKLQLFRAGSPIAGVHTRKYHYDDTQDHPAVLRYTVYALPDGAEALPEDVSALEVLDRGTAPWSDVERLPSLLRPHAPHAIVFEGRVEVPESGTYAFRLRSHAGSSQLWLGNQLVVDRPKGDWSETTAEVALEAGEQPLRLTYVVPGQPGRFLRMHVKQPGEKGWNRSVEEWLLPLE